MARIYRADDLRVQESGLPVYGDVEYESPDGKKKLWAERIKSPVFDHDGKMVGIQLLFWDVTRRKEAENALAQERFLLNTLLDNIPDSIYLNSIEEVCPTDASWPKPSDLVASRRHGGLIIQFNRDSDSGRHLDQRQLR